MPEYQPYWEESEARDESVLVNEDERLTKWKCPRCGQWVKEEISKICSYCKWQMATSKKA